MFYVVNKKDHPLITVTYFEKDAEKEGGRYVTFSGTVKKYDDFARELGFSDGKKYPWRISPDEITRYKSWRTLSSKNNYICIRQEIFLLFTSL